MTTLEIILFAVLFIWVSAIVMKADKLITNIHKRLEELERKEK